MASSSGGKMSISNVDHALISLAIVKAYFISLCLIEQTNFTVNAIGDSLIGWLAQTRDFCCRSLVH